MSEKKETVGAVSYRLQQKDPDTRDPIELGREMLTDYEKNFYECLNTHQKRWNHSFYIVVLTKKERLMQNVLRNYFTARKSCPTPNYDQIVYWYNHKEDKIEFIWVIPSQDTCRMFKEHVLEIVPEERGLLQYVLDFADGTLMNLALSLNNEIKG